MALRGVLLEAVRGGPVRDEQGIERVGRDAAVAQAAELPEDSRELRAAKDSNSVSVRPALRELPAGAQLQRPDAQLRARFQARRAALWQPLRALARAQREPADAREAWSQPAAEERPSRVPLAAALPWVLAPQEQAAEQLPRAWLRRLEERARRRAPVQQPRARAAEQPQPAAGPAEPRPQASCGLRERQLLSRPYRPRPSVLRQLRHRQRRENARALLPRPRLRSNWSASFSRPLRLPANNR